MKWSQNKIKAFCCYSLFAGQWKLFMQISLHTPSDWLISSPAASLSCTPPSSPSRASIASRAMQPSHSQPHSEHMHSSQAHYCSKSAKKFITMESCNAMPMLVGESEPFSSFVFERGGESRSASLGEITNRHVCTGMYHCYDDYYFLFVYVFTKKYKKFIILDLLIPYILFFPTLRPSGVPKQFRWILDPNASRLDSPRETALCPGHPRPATAIPREPRKCSTTWTCPKTPRTHLPSHGPLVSDSLWHSNLVSQRHRIWCACHPWRVLC